MQSKASFNDIESLAERVAQAIVTDCMIQPDSRVLAAVSGGADSVAMLLILAGMGRGLILSEAAENEAPLQVRSRVSLRFDLEAVHVEHGIRGEESKADARFVQELCDRLGIRCNVVTVDAPALARRLRTGPEDAARQARYEAFDRVRLERGAERVAIAHHLADQAETFMLHLTRGAGLTGLAGMRTVNGVYIRPLLRESPETLRAYLRSIGQRWREDETNSDPRQPRAMIRTSVMPLLRRINPRASEAICRTASIVSREVDLLNRWTDGWIDSFFRRTPYGGFLFGLHAEPANEDAFLARAIVRLASRLNMPPPEYARINALLYKIRGLSSGVENLSGGWRSEITASRVHFISPRQSNDTAPVLSDCTPYEITNLESGSQFDGVKTQAVDRTLLSRAVWRTRRPGDWMRPFGMPGRKLLSDLFTDKHIDRPFRDYVPLLTVGDEVLWVVGVCASERLRVTPDTRAQSVLVRWTCQLIWETQ